MKVSIWFGVAAMLASGGADARRPAAAAGKAQVAPIRELARCRAIIDSSQRLSCFDQATAALLTAEQKADIIVVDREQVEKARRTGFGFGQPDAALFRNHGAPIAELDQLQGALASASADAGGQWMFQLRDGAVWQQIDTDTLARVPRPGDPVLIRRAALGSFRLSVAKTPGVKVKRVR